MAIVRKANPILEKLQTALQLQQNGELEKAQRLYKSVLKKAPKNADANHLLGVTYRQLGFPKRALEYIQKAIAISPNQAVFYANLARTMSDMGTDADSILATCKKALSLDPNLPAARNMKAIALTKLDRLDDARNEFTRLVVDQPNYAEAYRNFGVMLRDNKEFEEAQLLFTKAITLDPENVQNYVDKAKARFEAKEYEDALKELEDVLPKFPDDPNLVHEMARLMFHAGEYDKGFELSQKAIDLEPHEPNRKVTRAVMLIGLGQCKEARDLLLKARREFSEFSPTLTWNLSLAYLGNGELEEGWALHHSRFECTTLPIICRKFHKPEWDGSDLTGKRIMVWIDQGIGDALRMGTMLHDLIATGADVVIEVTVKLVEIFKRSFPDAEVRLPDFDVETFYSAKEDFDYHICMGDLARYYRSDIQAFKKAKVPAFAVDLDRARDYYKRIPNADNTPIVGLSWRSQNLAPGRSVNYLSVLDLPPILEVEGITFLNLQYRFEQKELDYIQSKVGDRFVHFSEVDQFNDLEGAGALVNCCDLVLTANTSVCDLTGIFGVPAWTNGYFSGAFQLGEERGPWYPTLDYSVIQMGESAVSRVPDTVKRLIDWRDNTFSPVSRLERLGLA